MTTNLPLTMRGGVYGLHSVTLDYPLACKAWQLLNRYLESNHHPDLPSPAAKIYSRVMMVFILTAYLEQIRRADPTFHPFLNWGECRRVMGDLQEVILRRFAALGFIGVSQPGASS
jgi:hypothetical protein